MSDSDRFDDFNVENEGTGTSSDTYTSESSADIYRTPDVGSGWDEKADSVGEAREQSDSGMMPQEKVETEFSGGMAVEEKAGDGLAGAAEAGGNAEVEIPEVVFQDTAERTGVFPVQVVGPENPYGGSMQTGNFYANVNSSMQNGRPNDSGYGPNMYGGPYGGGVQTGTSNDSVNNGGQYGSSMQNGRPNDGGYGPNMYGGPYGGGVQTGTSNDSVNNGGQYGSSMQNGRPNDGGYGPNMYGGQYGGGMQTGNPYQNGNNGAQYNGNAQYGNTPQGKMPYGIPPYGNNPYSPYAAPVKKNNTGLIVGIVVAVIVLFILAVSALAYKAVSLFAEENKQRIRRFDEYNFDDDDWERDRNEPDYDDNDFLFDDEYNYDDWYDQYDDDFFKDGNDYDYDYNDDKYYSLHDDIKTDLSYSVAFEYFEYDTDYDNVDILVSYPVIKGDKIPNLDKINSEIRSEINVFTEYFEEEYEPYLTEEDYFSALASGYVTYMDEERMSVVFSEYVYGEYYTDVYLYCINIDMENGVILDNENILSIDDAFSVEFRQKSDIQNGEVSALTMMSDQEITKFFNSDNVIVFYTPKGMEIGFNYDDGWVTVTYEDYEKYLKVF